MSKEFHERCSDSLKGLWKNVKQMKSLLTILYVIIACAILATLWFYLLPNKARDLPEIIKDGRLTIITDSSSMGFSSKGDSIYGFQYEIAKAFANSLGVELVVIEENNVDDAIQELIKANCDIMANFMPHTIQYENQILFSHPFKKSRQVLVQRIDNLNTKGLIKHQFDLAKDTIYIPRQSPHKLRLQNLSDEIGDTIFLIEIADVSKEKLVGMVSLGEIKQTICDEGLAQKLKISYPNIDVSLPISLHQKLCWAVHAEAPLLQEHLNLFLADFIGSSEYWNLYRKYY